MQEGVKTIDISRVKEDLIEQLSDSIAIEEPLRIFIVQESENGKVIREAGIILRTPGQDEELAVGYLFNEGILQETTEIKNIFKEDGDYNSIYLLMDEKRPLGIQNKINPRKVLSSCGICGSTDRNDLLENLPVKTTRHRLSLPVNIFFALKQKLNHEQRIFKNTGGLHAAGLFSHKGDLIMIREDIGRHNALDKICGHAFIEKKLPLSNCILLLSGRTGFELIQKAAMAQIPVIASIGAPSSMAIEAAEETGITLIGFLGKDKFNVYTCFDNIITKHLKQGENHIEDLQLNPAPTAHSGVDPISLPVANELK